MEQPSLGSAYLPAQIGQILTFFGKTACIFPGFQFCGIIFNCSFIGLYQPAYYYCLMITNKMASFRRGRIFTALIISFASLLTLNGQGGFRSGTIIVNDETIIHGEISPVFTDGIITSCFCRAGSTGESLTFAPGDIQGWHLDGGRQFISGGYISPETSDMFLEILFDGISDLFYYNDLSSDHYIIKDRNGRLFTLKSYSKKGKSSIPEEETDLSGVHAVLRISMADACMVISAKAASAIGVN